MLTSYYSGAIMSHMSNKSIKELEDDAIVDLALFEQSVAFQADIIKNHYDANKIDEKKERILWVRLGVEIRQLLAYIRSTKERPEYKLFSTPFKKVVDEILKQYKDYKDIQ